MSAEFENQIPGPSIEEVPSGDRPITGVGVDTGAMLLETLKGPLVQTPVSNFAEFARIFGGYINSSIGAYEVDNFFREGGKGNTLLIGRVIHRTDQAVSGSYDATKAAVMLQDGTPVNTLNVEAASPGEWGSLGSTALSVVIAADAQHPAAGAGSDFTADVAAGAVEATVVSKKGLRIGSLVAFIGSGKTEYRILTEVSSAVVASVVVHTIKWTTPLWFPYTTAATSTLVSQEFSIEVRENGVTIETWFNLTMVDGDSRYAETIVNDPDTGSNFIAVTDQDAEVVATGNINLPLNVTAGDSVTIFPGTFIARTFLAVAGGPAGDQFLVGGSASASRDNLLTVIQGAGLPLTAIAGGGDDIDLTMDALFGSVANIAMTENTTGARLAVTGFASGASGPGEDLPATTTPGSAEVLTGGSNGSALTDADFIGDPVGRTGFHMFDAVRLNALAAPGQVSAAVITSGVIFCENRIDCYYVADAPMGFDKTALLNFRNNTLGLDSTKVVIMGDWTYKFDPIGTATNPKKAIPFSGAYMGIAARVHALPPPDGRAWQTPAGTGKYGKVTTSLGRVTELSDTDIGIINEAGIIGIRNKTGFGDIVWGGRMPTSDVKTRYINKRTSLIFIEVSVDDGTLDLTFKNNEIKQNRLGKNIVRRIGRFLSLMRKEGGLAGEIDEEAFFVVSDETTTTQEQVDVGGRITEVGVALQTPGEFLVFRIRQIAPGQQVIEEV